MSETAALWIALAVQAAALVAYGVVMVRAHREQARTQNRLHGDLAAHWRYMRLRAAAMEAKLDQYARCRNDQ